MPRFYLDSPLPKDSTTVTLAGREARHATTVFRLGVGRALVLFDGTGVEYDATVTAADRKSVELRIDTRRTVDREPPIAISVAVAVPKGKRMSQLIRGCSELGVAAIVPLRCDRSVVKAGRGADKDESPERWHQVAIEAAKQSGRARVTRIEPVATLREWIDTTAFDGAFYGAISPSAVPIREALATISRRTDGAEDLQSRPSLLIVIGPEGDFTIEETAALEAANVRPVSLGTTILRVETAAVAAAAAATLLFAK